MHGRYQAVEMYWMVMFAWYQRTASSAQTIQRIYVPDASVDPARLGADRYGDQGVYRQGLDQWGGDAGDP